MISDPVDAGREPGEVERMLDGDLLRGSDPLEFSPSRSFEIDLMGRCRLFAGRPLPLAPHLVREIDLDWFCSFWAVSILSLIHI